MLRFTLHGKRWEMALGSFADVGLAKAAGARRRVPEAGQARRKRYVRHVTGKP